MGLKNILGLAEKENSLSSPLRIEDPVGISHNSHCTN